jgi:hypothetical protein
MIAFFYPSILNLIDIFFHLWYIKNMEYALEKRIGNSDLFTVRKEELTHFFSVLN